MDFKIDHIDDGPGKPVGVRRPILAFGNSDGDQQMLEWTASGSGLRFMGMTNSISQRASDLLWKDASRLESTRVHQQV